MACPGSAPSRGPVPRAFSIFWYIPPAAGAAATAAGAAVVFHVTYE